ncbi:MAG: LacI family DNA-binding transcriptional regulator [Lachnospiraceae bacterium]|nr:LacI family DNA-binding transcriptional regulator [Lachnospiraceae bacterium]
MAVIKDVAKLAGVSVSTVSKYLNAPDSLKDNTRKLVEDAVQKLHYTPNLLARNLRVQSSRTIAVIAQEISNPFHVTIYNTIRKEAMKANLSVVLYSADDIDGDISKLFEDIPINYFSGIIVTYLQDVDKCIEFANRHTNTPIAVMCNDNHFFDEFDSKKLVYGDFTKATSTMAQFLVDLGKKQIAYIGIQTRNGEKEPKYRGFAKVMKKNGLVPNQVIRLTKTFTEKTGYEATEELLAGKHQPDAIFVDTDIMAVGVLSCLKDHKIRVPKDICVTGFDDIVVARYCCPALTTMHVPIEEMSIEAFRLMMNQINHVETERESPKIFVPKLVVRESAL